MTGDAGRIEAVAALLHGARVTILTGAGVSADSGIPTFREAQTGLWARYRPEELASPHAFARTPDRVWEWYEWRRALVAAAEPNPAHIGIAALDALAGDLTLVTQNVDGLHQMAGSRNVIELHGNIGRTKCAVDGRLVDAWADDGSVPPRCPHCGGPLRPDVVWFGETLPQSELEAARQAAIACDVFLSIGTSGVVQPAAALPVLARTAGAHVVVMKPDDDMPLLGMGGVTHLRGTAASLVPELVRLAGDPTRQ